MVSHVIEPLGALGLAGLAPGLAAKVLVAERTVALVRQPGAELLVQAVNGSEDDVEAAVDPSSRILSLFLHQVSQLHR